MGRLIPLLLLAGCQATVPPIPCPPRPDVVPVYVPEIGADETISNPRMEGLAALLDQAAISAATNEANLINYAKRLEVRAGCNR